MVALDGSSFAEAAPAPGALHLVQVVQPSANIEDSPYEQGTLLESADRLQGQAQRGAQDYLHAVAERVRTGELAESKLQVTWSVAVAEDVAATLAQLAEDGEDIALIALASHGCGGLQRWALGSVAERVLEATRIALLIVRPLGAADEQERAASHAEPVARHTE